MADDGSAEEVLNRMIEHLSPPEGQGNAYFLFSWKNLVVSGFLLPYLLDFDQGQRAAVVLVAYSVLVIVGPIAMIARFKRSMQFVSNPFDFVRILMILWIFVTVVFGFADFNLWRINPLQYAGNMHGPFAAVYFSLVTMTTVGYGDIAPAMLMSRSLAIFEILTGVWFVVTVVPVAVADQAERMRHQRVTRQRLLESLKKNQETLKADGHEGS